MKTKKKRVGSGNDLTIFFVSKDVTKKAQTKRSSG